MPDIIIEGHQKKIIGRNTETMIESSSVSREHRKFPTYFLFTSDLISLLLFFSVVIKPKLEDSVMFVRFIGKSPAGKQLTYLAMET